MRRHGQVRSMQAITDLRKAAPDLLRSVINPLIEIDGQFSDAPPPAGCNAGQLATVSVAKDDAAISVSQRIFGVSRYFRC